MRTLARNQKLISYRLYTGKTEAMVDGLYTSEKVPTYADPVQIYAMVTAARGTTDLDMFGINVPYTNTVLVNGTDCPIDEHSLLEIDGDPYIVLLVAKSLNHITYAVRKVNRQTELE